MTKIEVTGQMILPKMWTVTEVFRKQWGLNICLPGACACALTPYKHIEANKLQQHIGLLET